MNELIKVNHEKINDQHVKTVNARELHAFLEIGKDFSNWIKSRIKKYGFTEDQDFVCSPVLASSGRGGHNALDYHLSLDMAKEISMVERNAKGKEARQYFIECERVAQQPIDPMKALNDPAAMRGLLLSYSEKVLALEEEVKEQAPKIAAFDRIANADGLTCITDTAKSLQVRPKDLFTYLSANQWIYRKPGGKGWIAYQPKLQQGLLFHKVTTISLGDGHDRITEQVLVTPKGLTKLAGFFQEANA